MAAHLHQAAQAPSPEAEGVNRCRWCHALLAERPEAQFCAVCVEWATLMRLARR